MDKIDTSNQIDIATAIFSCILYFPVGFIFHTIKFAKLSTRELLKFQCFPVKLIIATYITST